MYSLVFARTCVSMVAPICVKFQIACNFSKKKKKRKLILIISSTCIVKLSIIEVCYYTGCIIFEMVLAPTSDGYTCVHMMYSSNLISRWSLWGRIGSQVSSPPLVGPGPGPRLWVLSLRQQPHSPHGGSHQGSGTEWRSRYVWAINANPGAWPGQHSRRGWWPETGVSDLKF